jgi:hypothetical protein
MAIAVHEIASGEVLPAVRKALGLPPSNSPFDDELLAAMVRRDAGILCPCSRASLIGSTIKSLEFIFDEEDLRERIEMIIDGLVSVGDLLEISDVTTGDADAKTTWVFLAPPGFVIRANGSAFLCGLTPDEALPLPDSYQSRVIYSGYSRSIRPQPDEPLASALSGYGLIEHSEQAWLRLPKIQSAQAFLSDLKQRLSALPPSGDVEDLEIIDTARPNNYYKGRWTKPRAHTGIFVARRERDYGAAIWGLAEREGGRLTKFLDLPLKGYKWRGRDAAWHILLALDRESGAPQKYRRRTSPDGAVILDFFSPIPVWAQRRLAIFGESVARGRCLFSFKIAIDELPAEEKFLSDYLWLMPTDM